jgi:polysaccharide export outer membrane protein
MARDGFGIRLACGFATIALFAGAGCWSQETRVEPAAPVPAEMSRVSVPARVIGPSDVLHVEAVRVIPLPPYRVETGDILYVTGKTAGATQIDGLYPVESDGSVIIGAELGGPVAVRGRTTEEVRQALAARMPGADVTVTLAEARGVRQIAGQHVVGTDGAIVLGTYGRVAVGGKTADEAKAAIEAHLAGSLYRPEVAVSVGR